MVANRRIDFVVASELRLGLPAGALLLGFQAFYDAVVLGPRGADLVKFTLATAVLCVAAWFLVRTDAFAFPRRILAAIVVTSVVGLQITHYAYTGSLGYSLATGFVHLGAGYLMIWPRWGIALSAASSIAWLVVTLQFDAPPEGMVALAAGRYRRALPFQIRINQQRLHAHAIAMGGDLQSAQVR